MAIFNVEFIVFCFQLAAFTNGEPAACVMELECAECIPENMPLVTSHRAAAGVVRVPHGDPVSLSCGAGKFLAFPLLATLEARCHAGRYRVGRDAALRHLLELGCQENVFEDALHHVEQCPPPLQGRSYQAAGEGAGAVSHVAALCYDADRGVAVRAHACNAPRNALPLAAHSHRSSPLTLLGNLNHMFDAKTRRDAERLYSDDVRMNRRLRELLRFQPFPFAGQALTSAQLLSPHYFEDQNMRVADFASNRVAAWQSVAAGNLRLLHEDVAALMATSRPHARLHVYAGTHGVASLRPAEGEGPRAELFLGAERRFPVPRYIWTVVHAPELGRAAAIVLLNDPFVAVSEVRAAVFCDSVCSRLAYLASLRRHRAFECPLYGLVFCCDVAGLAAQAPELPPGLLNVTAGAGGLLADAPAPRGP